MGFYSGLIHIGNKIICKDTKIQKSVHKSPIHNLDGYCKEEIEKENEVIRYTYQPHIHHLTEIVSSNPA